MKKALLTSLIACFFSIGAYAQTCTGDFEFNSQTEIDSFLIENPTCTEIDGSVLIMGSLYDPITNLDALQNIQHISGDLQLDPSANDLGTPFSLLGLSNLASIHGNFIIEDYSETLTSLEGLESLTTVGGLSLVGCYSLTSIAPLNNLTDAGGGIYLFDVPALNMFNIFPGITSLNSLTIMADNVWGNNISGFDNVTSCGDVTIYGQFGPMYVDSISILNNLNHCTNINLMELFCSHFNSLQQLHSCDNFFLDVFTDAPIALNSLTDCHFLQVNGLNTAGPITFNELVNCDHFSLIGSYPEINIPLLDSTSLQVLGNSGSDWGIDSLSTVTINAPSLSHLTSLDISNTNIVDLNFLSGLQTVDGNITIANNPLLTNCNIDYFCSQINADFSNATIENNLAGCNSLQEVLHPCMPNVISGTIFADLNCDGNMDVGEMPIPNQTLQQVGESVTGTFFHNGTYEIFLQDSSTTTLATTPLYNFTSPEPQSFSVEANALNIQNVDFGMCPISTENNASITAYTNFPPRSGLFSSVNIEVTNENVTTINGTVTFTAPEGSTLIPQENVVIFGNTATWILEDLAPFQTRLFPVFMNNSTSLFLGQSLTYQASVDVINDFNPSDNSYSFDATVVSSYDPNYKEVNREHINVADVTPESAVDLLYTIHFQNTGTAEAININVTDTISSDLNLNSLQIVASSHPCDLVLQNDRGISFVFNNINLPDSASNQEASNGYVQYRIRTNTNWQAGTVISNTAHIFFDDNDAIVTNTTHTVFYECTQTLGLTASDSEVCQGESISANTGGTWDTIDWTVNGESVVAENSYVLSNLDPGTYTIQTSASIDFCSTEESVQVLVHANPSVPTINLISPNMLQATGGTSYAWTFNGTPINTNSATLAMTASGEYGVVAINEFGCVSPSTTGSFVYTNTEELSSSALILYPNPAKTNLFVELSNSPTQLTITDMTGRIVFQMQQCIGRQSISLNGWAKGVYTLNISNSNGSERKQFVVE